MEKTRDIGEALNGWRPPVWPGPATLEGSYARLERLTHAHAAELDRAARADDSVWAYMPYGPFASAAAYGDWVAGMAARPDPWFYAIRNLATGQAEGVARKLSHRAEPDRSRSGILFSPALQGHARRPRLCFS